MKKITLAIAAAILPSFGLAQSADAIQEKLDALQQEIDALKSKPLVAGKTEFDMGGFIKLDAMWSSYSDTDRAGASVGDDFLVPSQVAVGDGSNGGESLFDMSAKTSRIYVKSVTDTGAGKLKSYIEMDFQTSGDERIIHRSSTGLRHAFVDYMPNDKTSILAGQTWTTFFNVGALPETVDFIGPTSGVIFNRQAQLRYTRKLASGGSFMLSAENPSTGFNDGGSGIAGSNFDDATMPDIVARYNGKSGNFSYSAAVMVREIRYDDGTLANKETAPALSLSGKYVFGNGDDLKFMVSNGHLGRYIALNAFRDGVIRADGGIDLISVTGAYVAYKHKWNDKLRSNLIYATSTADNPSSAVGDLTKTVTNTNINLMYSPAPKMTFGAEYIIAERETESGADGDLSRLQFTAKYVF